jgi:hypothetical protein
VDSTIFENLLNECESDSLDFKQEQYRFIEATENEKSEILKDIIAFANAWRKTDAYILIGIREIKGGRSHVVGISQQLDDASLQQFVNSKVQKPISFSYIPFNYEEKQIGIIQIPIQERPFYLRQKYGRVKPQTVYLRRGSSTAEAEPDEIADMGIISSKKSLLNVPILDCEFSDPNIQKLHGKEITITSNFIKINESIPKLSSSYNSTQLVSLSQPNSNFYKELYQFYQFQTLFKAVNLRLINTGEVTAFNACAEINVVDNGLFFITKNDFPKFPKKYHNFLTPELNVPPIMNRIGSRLSVKKNNVGWAIKINFGNIQPKAEDWLEESIFIGSTISQDIFLNMAIFADNIPDPIHIQFCIHFQVKEITKTVSELELKYDEKIKRDMDEFKSDD